jgi:hypothetical protein
MDSTRHSAEILPIIKMMKSILNVQDKTQSYLRCAITNTINAAALRCYLLSCQAAELDQIHNSKYALFDYNYSPVYCSDRAVDFVGHTDTIMNDYVQTTEFKQFALEQFIVPLPGEFILYTRRKWVVDETGRHKSKSLREVVLNYRYEPEIHGFYQTATIPEMLFPSDMSDIQPICTAGYKTGVCDCCGSVTTTAD